MQDNTQSTTAATSVLPEKHPLADSGPYAAWKCDFGWAVLDAKGFNCLRMGRMPNGCSVSFTDELTAKKAAASWN